MRLISVTLNSWHLECDARSFITFWWSIFARSRCKFLFIFVWQTLSSFSDVVFHLKKLLQRDGAYDLMKLLSLFTKIWTDFQKLHMMDNMMHPTSLFRYITDIFFETRSLVLMYSLLYSLNQVDMPNSSYGERKHKEAIFQRDKMSLPVGKRSWCARLPQLPQQACLQRTQDGKISSLLDINMSIFFVCSTYSCSWLPGTQYPQAMGDITWPTKGLWPT